MSNKYSIPEILNIHSYENLLLNNPNIPEQLMFICYNDIQKERVRLVNRLKVMSSQGVITREIRKELILEEKQEFIKFLCDVIRKYKIRESYITGFIDDMLTTFDDLDKNLSNLQLKQEIIDYMLKNQQLTPEQITDLVREKQDTEDFIIEIKNLNNIIA